MECWSANCDSAFFQYMQKCCLPSIIETEKKYFCTLVIETCCEKGRELINLGTSTTELTKCRRHYRALLPNDAKTLYHQSNRNISAIGYEGLRHRFAAVRIYFEKTPVI